MTEQQNRELILKGTSYEVDVEGVNVKVNLICGELDNLIEFKVNDRLAYYYIIKKLSEIVMDDIEIIDTAAREMIADKEHWLLDCQYFIDNFLKGNFKLISRTVNYDYKALGINFHLEIRSLKNNSLFNLKFYNDINEDILTTVVHADGTKNLSETVLIYADIVNDISSKFASNKKLLGDYTFMKNIK